MRFKNIEIEFDFPNWYLFKWYIKKFIATQDFNIFTEFRKSFIYTYTPISPEHAINSRYINIFGTSIYIY